MEQNSLSSVLWKAKLPRPFLLVLAKKSPHSALVSWAELWYEALYTLNPFIIRLFSGRLASEYDFEYDLRFQKVKQAISDRVTLIIVNVCIHIERCLYSWVAQAVRDLFCFDSSFKEYACVCVSKPWTVILVSRAFSKTFGARPVSVIP